MYLSVCDGDCRQKLFGLVLILIVMDVPLGAGTFATLHWYNNES